jgi:hypothetical protein
MKTKMTILALLATVTLLSGCAFLSALGTAGSTANAAGQLAIEEATAIAIQSGCKATATETLQQCYDVKAAKILLIAQVLETATIGSVLTDLQAALAKEVAAQGLTPEEAVPLQVFLQSIVNYLTPLVGNAVLAAPAIAVVNQVAAWVVSIASEYAPTVVSAKRAAKKLK